MLVSNQLARIIPDWLKLPRYKLRSPLEPLTHPCRHTHFSLSPRTGPHTWSCAYDSLVSLLDWQLLGGRNCVTS